MHTQTHTLVWILATLEIIFSLIENVLIFKIDTEYGSILAHMICKRMKVNEVVCVMHKIILLGKLCTDKKDHCNFI